MIKALGCAFFANGLREDSAPPTNAMVTVSGSLLVKSRRAWVAWLLISFTPKTSADGKDADTETARFGVCAGVSTGSSTC
jgi:hypothetical protein